MKAYNRKVPPGKWLVNGFSVGGEEPGAITLRQVGGRLAFGDYSVRFDERASLFPWVVEYHNNPEWTPANAFDTFRKARACARRLERTKL